MQFRVLGPIEVLADSGAVVQLGGGRERLVLAHLLMGADRLVPSERLIDSLWEDPPPTAKQQLQNLIAGLRRRLAAFDAHLVITRPFGYELRMGPHTLDLTSFRQLVAEARALHGQGRPAEVAGEIASTLGRAVGLWRGAPLSDAAPASEDADTTALIQGLIEERIAAVDLLVGALADAGLHDDVLAATSSHLADDPWNERLHEHRLRALAATGRRAEAGEAYLMLRRQLRNELGVDPGRALSDLNQQILEGADVATSATRSRPIPRELPALAWTLVGRETLLSTIVTRLGATGQESVAGPPAIVVLVGVGGVGKTALAIAGGHVLAESYPDGTLYAALGDGLGGAADAHDVLGRFLRALGVESAAIPVDPDERVALYRSTIDRKRVLVVLDNAMSEAQIRRLMPTASGSAAIITSRTKLAGLAGVRRETVPPLAPEAAVVLLAELWGEDRTLDDHALVQEIGNLCGYLPLALCVAGAKLATNEHLDLAELRDRLAHEHSRLDELSVGDIDVRASIATSITDLPVDALRLFGRLSVNPVGEWPAWVPRLLLHVDASATSATDASARATSATDTHGPDPDVATRRAMDELINRHLVEPVGRDAAGQPRFRMHRLVAELAKEHLAGHEPATARGTLTRRLVEAWLDLARVADAHLDPSARTPEGELRVVDGTAHAATAPSDWFEAEHLNLIAGVSAAVAIDERELAAALALAIRAFLTIRAYDDERERVLRIALDDYPETADQLLSAQLLAALFGVLAQQQRNAELPEIAGRFLDAARVLGNDELEQRALSQAGWSALVLDRFDEALEHYAEMGAVARRRGDTDGDARAQGQRGVVLRNMGRAEEGDPLLSAMVDAARAGGSRRSTCIWLVTRAEGLLDLDRLDEAQALLDEALAIAGSLRDELGEANCRLALARVHVARCELVRASAEFDLARPQLDAHATDGEDLDGVRLAVDIAAASGRWADAGARLDRLIEGRRRDEDSLQLASDLARAGRIRARLAQPDGAAETAESLAILTSLHLSASALRLPPFLRA